MLRHVDSFLYTPWFYVVNILNIEFCREWVCTIWECCESSVPCDDMFWEKVSQNSGKHSSTSNFSFNLSIWSSFRLLENVSPGLCESEIEESLKRSGDLLRVDGQSPSPFHTETSKTHQGTWSLYTNIQIITRYMIAAFKHPNYNTVHDRCI